jgi:hypothetical protein
VTATWSDGVMTEKWEGPEDIPQTV